MKWNFITGMLKGRPPPATRLLAVTPPRTGERTLLGVENLLGSIAVPEPFSLEIAGDAAGVTLLARCREGSFVKQQLGVHYPQARVSADLLRRRSVAAGRGRAGLGYEPAAPGAGVPAPAHLP